MSDKTQDDEESQDKQERAQNAPRDEGMIHVSEHLVIKDPESGEVLLNKRES